jgi:hypothetical protein
MRILYQLVVVGQVSLLNVKKGNSNAQEGS